MEFRRCIECRYKEGCLYMVNKSADQPALLCCLIKTVSFVGIILTEDPKTYELCKHTVYATCFDDLDIY